MTSRSHRRGRYGRPPLPEEQRRSIRWTVHLTPEDSRKIQARAELTSMSLSSFFRAAALRTCIRVGVPPVNLHVVGELARIGNNLNQAIRLLHQGRIAPELLPVLLTLQHQISAYRRDLMGLVQDSREGNSPSDSPANRSLL